MIAYERFFKTVFNSLRKKKRVTIFSKLSRSLTGGGHYERVDSKVPVKSGTGPGHGYLPIINSLIDILDFLVL